MTNNPSVPGSDGTTAMPSFDAAVAIEKLRQIIAQVPGFEPADSKVWLSIRRKSGFPDEYFESAANVVDASPDMVGVARLDGTALRSGVNLSNSIRALVNEALTLAAGLRFTDAKLRASLADASDQIYAIAPAMARTDKSLTPHIEAMRRASRRKGGRKKAAPHAPAGESNTGADQP
jgi:hypothetical protein